MTSRIAFIRLRTVLLAVVLTVSAADLALLELKRQAFRGGFLQAHRITGWQVPLFLADTMLLSLLAYGCVLALLASLASRFKWPRGVLVYQFVWLVGVGSLLVIGVRYEVGQYFSDFLGFTVLRNLGGGKVTDALHYVVDEGLPFAAASAMLASSFIAGHVALSRRLAAREPETGWHYSWHGYLKAGAGAAVGTVAMVGAVNSADDVRYNMRYTLAYSTVAAVLDHLTDFDGDGVGWFASPPDPEPLNAAVYPGALDRPDDGIDQDGLFGDFHYEPRPVPRYSFGQMRRNVVVIVLESARADALEMQIDGRPLMPNTRQLAQEGWSSGEYYSHTGFTSSSIKAIFSGRLAQRDMGGDNLFSLLKREGYQVGVFSAQAESFGQMAEDLRMRELADVYFDAQSDPAHRVFPSKALSSLKQSGEWVVSRFRASRELFDWKRPFVLYFNIQSAHFPYFHAGMPQIVPGSPIPRGAISKERRDWLRRTYYNALAYADHCVGEVVDLLKKDGVYEDTTVVVAGDHGEALFDDDFLGHGHFIDDAQTRAVFAMNRKAVHWTGALGQTDLLPLLMRAAGAEVEGARSGGPVFQVVGDLDHPQAIGYVESGGQRTSLNVQSGEADFFDGRGWIPRSQWQDSTGKNGRLRPLVLEWERLRWEDRGGGKNPLHPALVTRR